jgi:hypothetical protein
VSELKVSLYLFFSWDGVTERTRKGGGRRLHSGIALEDWVASVWASETSHVTWTL